MKQTRSEHKLLRAAYTAFNARDIGAVLALMHPDVGWPNGMEEGRVRGHSGVRSYWERQWAMIDSHVEPLRFSRDPGDRTTVEVHQVVRDLAGKIVSDQIVQHVYTIQDNLIQRMDITKGNRLKEHEVDL
jgi:hypothetical protein